MTQSADPQSERDLLAAMLDSQEACAEGSSLPLDSWTLTEHRIIAEEIGRRFAAGEPTDSYSVARGIEKAGKIGQVGGMAGVLGVAQDVVTTETGAVRALVDRGGAAALAGRPYEVSTAAGTLDRTVAIYYTQDIRRWTLDKLMPSGGIS